VSPVKYKLGFYIPEDGILRSHCCENLNSYIALHRIKSGNFYLIRLAVLYVILIK
jgi:hypothetical protein